jgi:hypothetical protein
MRDHQFRSPDTLENPYARTHPVPRVYTRRAAARAIPQPQADAHGSAALLALSVVTGVVAFLLVYSGWGL